MTKEEIQRVLALSLEYYKSEVFGTDKESKKPSSERIDWIYNKMKGGLETPKDLEEAAGEYSFNIPSKLFHHLSKEQQILWKKEIEQAYLAGAERDREQMMKEAVELELKYNVDYPSDWNQVGMVALYFYTSPTFKFGDKVRVIVLPKED